MTLSRSLDLSQIILSPFDGKRVLIGIKGHNSSFHSPRYSFFQGRKWFFLSQTVINRLISRINRKVNINRLSLKRKEETYQTRDSVNCGALTTRKSTTTPQINNSVGWTRKNNVLHVQPDAFQRKSVQLKLCKIILLPNLRFWGQREQASVNLKFCILLCKVAKCEQRGITVKQ